MTDPSRLKRLLAVSALSLATVAVPLTAAEPAQADSGYCGVRVQGPTKLSGYLLWAYTWYNKCTITVNEQLYFYSNGHTTGCYTLYPYQYMTAFAGTGSPDWRIQNC